MEHDKHRERMRQRYLSGGFNSFQEHELLEMLLFYAKPRGNTNPTAHALMERFGSLKNVMEASLDELKEVDGIGEQSAILFKLVTEFTRRYAIEAYRPKGYCFRDMKEIAMFIAPKFTGLDHEQLHMMLFNNRMNLLDHCIVSDGVVNSAEGKRRLLSSLRTTIPTGSQDPLRMMWM
ncbi:MAG: RadC family protein [Clostridia bacterium]|nr:RadC family protein [Clostridia bacterium]